MNANTSLLDSDNPEDNAFDDADTPRRRHKSAGEHSWSLRKRNGSASSDAAATITDSLASSDKLINEDVFGCDAKILESLRTSADSAESGSHSRSLSLGSKPHYTSQISEDFKVDVKPLDDEGKEQLMDVCNQIGALNVESDGGSEKTKDSSEDLLVALNEKNSSDTVDVGNSDLIQLGDESRPKASSVSNGVSNSSPVHSADITQSCEDLNLDTKLTEGSEKPLENGNSLMTKTDLYKLESMESLPSNSSSESRDSKENLSSKIKKTPKRTGNFFSNFLTSPFTPRMSKQSLSRTMQTASSQMESLRSRATDLAFRLGEYTKSFSPAVPGESNSKHSLLDLDEMPENEPRDIAGPFSESRLESMNPEEMGILMPGISFAGNMNLEIRFMRSATPMSLGFT